MTGSIDILKPLSTLLKAAPSINPSNIENFGERFSGEPRILLGLLGEKQECYLCAMQPTIKSIVLMPHWYIGVLINILDIGRSQIQEHIIAFNPVPQKTS